MTAGKLGPIAAFETGEIVAYSIRTATARSVYVFRTLAVDDALAAKVPGVLPHVRLLIHLHSAGRVRAAARFFRYLAARGISPSSLCDAFYVRVSIALGGRATPQERLRAFLRDEDRRVHEEEIARGRS
jgi:hypothetical protein